MTFSAAELQRGHSHAQYTVTVDFTALQLLLLLKKRHLNMLILDINHTVVYFNYKLRNTEQINFIR